MSFKKKLLFCLAFIVLLCGNLLLVEYYIEKANLLKSATALIYKIQSQNSLLRRHEKDFLQRKEKSYLVKYTNAFHVIKSDLDQLRQYFTLLELLQSEGAALELMLENYQYHFKQLADGQLSLGLTPEEGFHGKLRHNAHQIENYLYSISEFSLMNDLLFLRRLEKDFMLRLQRSYVEEWEDKIKEFQQHIVQTKLSHLSQETLLRYVNTYALSFREYAKQMLMLGLSHHEGIQLELRLSAHHIDQSLNDTTKRLVELSKVTEERVQQYMKILFILFMLGLLLLCIVPVFNFVATRFAHFQSPS